MIYDHENPSNPILLTHSEARRLVMNDQDRRIALVKKPIRREEIRMGYLSWMHRAMRRFGQPRCDVCELPYRGVYILRDTYMVRRVVVMTGPHAGSVRERKGARLCVCFTEAGEGLPLKLCG